MTQTGHDFYLPGQGPPARSGGSDSLRRWWPAIGGFVFLVVGIGALVAWSSLRDDDGGSNTSTEATSAVPMVAQLSDPNGGTATGGVQLELNNATGDICYQVTSPQLAYPFAVSLLDMGSGTVMANLGSHNSGSMGCAAVGLTQTQAVLASPETHSAEVQLPDGVVLRGALVYNPSVGGIDEVAAGDPAEGAEQGVEAPAAGDGSGKVGFILPDTESSDRWENFDRPLILAACEEAGLVCDVRNAEGEPEIMSAYADEMIADGVSVLVIANLDSESAAGIQQRASNAGIQNIDYDRLTLDGAADVYVSFDNVAVGREQGEGLIECLGDTEGKRIIKLHGSPTDNNATLVQQGYDEAIDGAGFEVVGEAAVPQWDNEQAYEIFSGLLEEAGGEIDGVISANDSMGLAAQQVLAENGLEGTPVTGQDATVDSLRAILQGNQCMTVYKPVEVEANAVVAAAAALIRGTAPPANATINNGVAEIPFVQGQVTPIFFDDVRQPVEDGHVTRDEVCAGIEDLCAQAGIGGG